ncbi:hypothetical protein F4560_000118 [Saccharothrix ecbatanensis]|uniref:BP74 N-terminal domain-containing protein n=1 Tax=Saccharothrix ecbatanensis TaxID=1105145 RepID=A0A7W9LXZ7_9PSEU|nr:calmodulin-binding protein [Saccharothrix ecbatanensis]MBB5800350.1 hypothetical protein [Saccharothrix ecbatanensis]
MRRPIAVLAALAALLPALVAAPAQAADRPAPSRAAVAEQGVDFEFIDITREKFVFRLTDPDKIEHARRIISGEETEVVHVMGRITKVPADYNRKWSYHLKSDSVSFFDYGIEVCDATIPYVEDHLDEVGGAFLPGLFWCPWTSKLTREVG